MLQCKDAAYMIHALNSNINQAVHSISQTHKMSDTGFFYIDILKERKSFKHNFNLCFSGVIPASNLLSYLFCSVSGIWVHAFQLRTEFRWELGRLWRMVGLDSTPGRIKGVKCLICDGVWCELTQLLLWVSHCKLSLHKRARKKPPSWLIHGGYWVGMKAASARPATQRR